MKVLVIGGSGFVGSKLCQLFSLKGVKFQIVDKVASTLFSANNYIADIRDPLTLELLDDAEVIVNLAAEHRDDVTPKSLYQETNVQGAHNICELARSKNIGKLIFTSSVAVYGFAKPFIDEAGIIAPFNEYGRTKWEAECIYRQWQSEDPENRTLVIIRPTVIFGEKNRGNVYNLLKQIASGRFIMIGKGLNCKSLAYVDNVAAFLEYCLSYKAGAYVYNYVDKPDLTMNQFILIVKALLGSSSKIKIRLPYFIGYCIGVVFDLFAFAMNGKFSISAIRIRKFCADSVYESAIQQTDFTPPIPLLDAIERTVRYEFIECRPDERVFYSE